VSLTVRLQEFATFLLRVLPLKLADRIAILIGLFCCFKLKRRREYIIKNLCYIFAGELSRQEFCRLTKNTFKNFALCMVDFLRLGFIKKEEIIRDVKAVNLENLNRALSYKKGCVLLTLHIGNWDYAGAYLSAMGFPMIALVEETEFEMFRLYTRHRERTGLKTYPVSRTGYAFIDMMKNNRIMAVLADRDITKKGSLVNFFTGKRRIPQGLGEFVVKRKIPVVFAYMVLMVPPGKKRYLGVVEEPVFFTTPEEFNNYTISHFEETIKKYPDQWFVFHPEWIE